MRVSFVNMETIRLLLWKLCIRVCIGTLRRTPFFWRFFHTFFMLFSRFFTFFSRFFTFFSDFCWVFADFCWILTKAQQKSSKIHQISSKIIKNSSKIVKNSSKCIKNRQKRVKKGKKWVNSKGSYAHSNLRLSSGIWSAVVSGAELVAGPMQKSLLGAQSGCAVLSLLTLLQGKCSSSAAWQFLDML